MNTRKITAVGAVLLANLSTARLAFADASYQSTTQITGGTLLDTVKSVSFISKSMANLTAPTSTITMVHGNQKATVSKDSTEIIDLDKETITHIDNLKKTYTVTTFAQMRQFMADLPKQMQQAQAKMQQAQAQQPKTDLKMTFDANVKNTGVTKEVNGLMAQEQIITLTMKVSDPNVAANPNDPNSISYVITTDAWIAPDPPEIKEIQDFDIRMGKKMMEGVDAKALAQQWQSSGNASMAMLLGNKPGASDAMDKMAEEMAKLKGTRVLEITSMGGMGTGVAAPTTAAGTPPPPPPSGSSVVGDVATNTASQTASGESSKLGVFGSALTNSTLSVFHKKKSTPPPAPAPTPAATPTTTPGQPTTTVLMATTTQKTNFSQEPIPFTAFSIPAGYKNVPPPSLGK